jgi:serine O-acetyltransferase
VTIGDGAMIAANSLVIDNVPPGSTAIGVPAKILPRSIAGKAWRY